MNDTRTRGPVPETTQQDRIAHFAHKLACETDAADVHAMIEDHTPFVLVDTRSRASWSQGHIPSALHLPTGDIRDRATKEIAQDTLVVVHCWGPGCNGATKAAWHFASLGYEVKEMLGGFEYWTREGYPIENEAGPITTTKDWLTAPLDAVTCEC